MKKFALALAATIGLVTWAYIALPQIVGPWTLASLAVVAFLNGIINRHAKPPQADFLDIFTWEEPLADYFEDGILHVVYLFSREIILLVGYLAIPIVGLLILEKLDVIRLAGSIVLLPLIWIYVPVLAVKALIRHVEGRRRSPRRRQEAFDVDDHVKRSVDVLLREERKSSRGR